eukprot:CAMPEP_0197907150 /NCGR_PEP_ID=MMETSP1439-20131203/64211_1 /TAXON_ID=66791 /ORGANISM="Gonyaulax spinifera, Strain CCMP409" /LENGTH=45 /DNA_ID= /DNA_START= /DNA_END= /DNA_ORIENTATION=
MLKTSALLEKSVSRAECGPLAQSFEAAAKRATCSRMHASSVNQER